MKNKLLICGYLLCFLLFSGTAFAGVYSDPMGYNPSAIDAGIPGFVGPDGDGKTTDNNYVNPVFTGWATGYIYEPFDYDAIYDYNPTYANPENTLGPVTGNNGDIASLGDMNRAQIDAWLADPVNNPGPGQITLTFGQAIYNGAGQDFAVFENGFGGTTNFFAELGYVDVSTDGINWSRFVSDVVDPPGPSGYLQQDATNIYNLAGKHKNAYGDSWGTPFDLETLLDDPNVLAGLVDLNEINFVRIVDIPGDGQCFFDGDGDAISDAWVTWGSGGVDLEAVGVINAVPIPGAVWMLASGLLGIWGIKRKIAIKS